MTYATVKIDGKEGFVGKMADTAEAIGCVMDYLSNKFTDFSAHEIANCLWDGHWNGMIGEHDIEIHIEGNYGN